MYRVKGSDQKEYGPVSADQVRLWIQEGRLNRFSLLQQEGDPAWKPLEQFSEFASLVAAAPTVMPPGGLSPTGGGAIPTYAAVADPQLAAKSLQLPALLILILAVIGLIFSVAGLFLKGAWIDLVVNSGMPLDGNMRSQLDQMRAVGYGDYFSSALGLAVNVLVIIGAVKMQRLQSWGLAMTAAILIMLPCSGCCCLIGLPLGIWAIVTLNKPEVKGAFR